MVPTQISCRVFSPSGFFFRQVFSGLRSDSNVFVNCQSAQSVFMLCAVRLDVRGCSITYCYSSRCSAETTKINLMVFAHVVYCVVELKYNFFHKKTTLHSTK